jgi:hypothetical protein
MTAAALKTTGSLVSDNHQLRSPGEGARLGSAGLPYELLAGFDRLARSPPLWPAAPAQWDAVVESVRSFAFDWHATATASGWPLVSL